MPLAAPGTPLGKTGSRWPCNGFLVLNMSLSSNDVGSNWPPLVHAAKSATIASNEPVRTNNSVRRFDMRSLTLAVGGDQLAQNFGAAARARRRCRIGHHHIGPFARRAGVAGLPGRERQQLARAVAKHPVLCG